VGQPGEKKYKIVPSSGSIPSCWLFKLTLTLESSAVVQEINKESRTAGTRRKMAVLIAKT
tara:strand:+ start:3131 stop:3310 length:180 start_codon:yes stop_codon:yes gene_type:complete